MEIKKLDMMETLRSLPKREEDAHKYSVGTSLLLCGHFPFSGAAILSAKAAFRGGGGMVKLHIEKDIYPVVAAAVPEAVFSVGDFPLSKENEEELEKEIKRANAILIGCGLGINNRTRFLVKKVIDTAECPIVFDADGINIISENIELIEQCKIPIIFTPHEGEMSRLIGKTVGEISCDRAGVAAEYAKKFGAVIVLKGKNTVIADKNGSVSVCQYGNSGMAVAGMGDVLAGLITSFLAQGSSAFDAACCAVVMHSVCGDGAAERLSSYSLMPSDILEELPTLFSYYEHNR